MQAAVCSEAERGPQDHGVTQAEPAGFRQDGLIERLAAELIRIIDENAQQLGLEHLPHDREFLRVRQVLRRVGPRRHHQVSAGLFQLIGSSAEHQHVGPLEGQGPSRHRRGHVCQIAADDGWCVQTLDNHGAGLDQGPPPRPDPFPPAIQTQFPLQDGGSTQAVFHRPLQQ